MAAAVSGEPVRVDQVVHGAGAVAVALPVALREVPHHVRAADRPGLLLPEAFIDGREDGAGRRRVDEPDALVLTYPTGYVRPLGEHEQPSPLDGDAVPEAAVDPSFRRRQRRQRLTP